MSQTVTDGVRWTTREFQPNRRTVRRYRTYS